MQQKFNFVVIFLHILCIAFYGCNTSETFITVPRPVFGVCVATPCRVQLQAIRGRAPRHPQQVVGMLFELREFYRRHPQDAWYRFDSCPKLQMGTLEGNLRISPEKTVRVRLAPEAFIQLDSLHFPQNPSPQESAVLNAEQTPSSRTFRCGQNDNGGIVFSVPWEQNLQTNAHQHSMVWPPLRIFHPTGRLIVFSHWPANQRSLWMALADCLGPIALVHPQPGEIAHAQAIGIRLWQWLEPTNDIWRALNQHLRSQPHAKLVTAAVVQGTVARVFHVQDPVDFLKIMVREHILAPDAVWAAWTRLLQAGVSAVHFSRLKPYLLDSRAGERTQ